MPDDLLHHLWQLATDDGEGGPSAAVLADVLWMARYSAAGLRTGISAAIRSGCRPAQ